jgi:uncharacterized protein (DUF2147 family)
MTMRTLFLLLCLSFATTSLHAQSVLGRWTTIDDNTGKPRSVVEITEKDGKLHGRIVDLYDKSKIDKLCTLCPADRHNTKIVGLEIIRGMAKTGSEWSKGTILDPETGKVYDCKIWLEDGMLKVRGYVAFFYRTQTWVRGK